jgi:replicative DNA helicase
VSEEINQIEAKVVATLMQSADGIIFFIESGYEPDQVFNNFKDLSNLIFSYYNRYKKLPTSEILNDLCSKHTNSAILQDQLLEVKFEEPAPDQIKYWIESLIENNRKNIIHKTILATTEAIKSGNVDLATKTLQKGVVESNDLANRNLIKVSSLGGNARKRYESYLCRKENPETSVRIPTGFSALDENIGGVGPGELNVILGRPGHGKSMFLLNVGYNAWKNYNKNVFYFSYEMYNDQIEARLDSRHSGLDYKKIKDCNLGDIEEKRYKMMLQDVAKRQEAGHNFFIIKPPQKTTVAVVRNEIEKIIKTKGIKPDLIILDYLTLMAPLRVTKDQKEHNRIGETALDCRDLAAEYGVACWTASQLNRAGAREKNVDSDNVYGSDELAHHSDMILAIRRPEDNISQFSNTLSINSIKVRDGALRNFEIYCDFSYSLMADKKEEGF